jgi:sulfite exporter TauE/SafE
MDGETSVFWRLLFLTPLIATHCAGMCGPLMLAFRFGWRQDGTARTGLAAAELGAYQSGRLLIYVALGAGAGWLGQHLLLTLDRWALGASIVLAVLFTLAALVKLGWVPRLLPDVTGGWAARAGNRAMRLFPGQRLASAGALGVAMAFLPCGLALAALGLAADSASPWQGALLMGLLVVLTTPALAPFALAAAWGPGRWASLRRHERWVVPLMLLISAAGILWVGLERMESGHCPMCVAP